MAQRFIVAVEGLTELDFTKGAEEDIKKAASQAINTTLRNKRARAAKLIRDQVNLPARYVSPSGKGLYVAKQASPGKLEGIIRARGRATSLAQFVQGSPRVGKAGVVVEVHPGKAKFLKRVFPIKLPQGSADVATKYNLGLAIRLRPGEKLDRKVTARSVSKGLYVLYGPSVDQVFRSLDGSGVANDLVSEIERDLSEEFLRLLEL
ncbi:hypothetical protein [Synechococcus virus S-ESS1]|uniref:Minor tail protein n=1 Tax=Synechococcus virus S-ESS1 TaxID=1964565 RepID=A0A1V0DX25_9CAUD|nr:hypothetical protein JT310_gp17 [Synechococcus virus S-ESS1]ARB05714.1 hypothetical protein [Synechococcus virus S-ESS1]